jgi:hypothetical protein
MSVVISYRFVYLVVTYRGEWTLVANRLQIEWLVPGWEVLSIRLVNGLLAVVSAAMLLRALRRNTVFNPAAVLFLAMSIVSSASAVLHGDNTIRAYSVVLLAVAAACTVAPRGLGIPVGIGTCCVIAAVASGLALVVGCVLVPVFILAVTERPWPIDTADWLIWAIPGALLCYPVARRLSGDQILETPGVSGEPAAHSAAHGGAQGDHQTEAASR